MNLTDKQVETLAGHMRGLVPADGTRIGNKTLSEEFLERIHQVPEFVTADDDDYWFVRDALIAKGELEKGKGKGGSVRLILNEVEQANVAEAEVVAETEAVPIQQDDAVAQREIDLYEPLHQTLRNYWVKVAGIKFFVSNITAQQGRRVTGGKWTRPDITFVAVRVYPFIPGRSVEVITFEIKPLDYFGVDGVFEAAAFTAFAQRSYLVIQISEGLEDNEDFDRVQQECKRFGIGLMTFVEAANGDTLEEVVSPALHSPDPAATSVFISRQMSSEQKQELSDLIH